MLRSGTARPAFPIPALRMPGAGLIVPGTAALYLSVIVLLPMAAVALRATEGGLGAFWEDVTAPQAVAALRSS